MKLTIQNTHKITGTYEKLHIDNVSTYDDKYIFHCARRGERTTYDIVLSREGRKDADGDWIYHFYEGSNKTQCVTPGWFQNMGHAVSAVISEFDSQYLL